MLRFPELLNQVWGLEGCPSKGQPFLAHRWIRFGFGGVTVLVGHCGYHVSFYTTVDVESQCLKGSRTYTFWANASLVFCLFRYAIKNLWREGCSNTPAPLWRRSSGFGNLLSTLVRVAANGALWRVYYFVHWIIRPLVKIVESGLVSEGAPCLCRVTEWIKDIFQIGTLSNADM